MTPEAQRIAIAKACPTLCYKNDDEYFYRWRDGWGRLNERFDPLSDLNVMHEAEKALTKDQKVKYLDALYFAGVPVKAAVFTTAAQRAEAFLQACNLWK